jgi:hypothetical protein
MKPQNKTGLWKPWKNKLRFSTVPTAPTAANYYEKEQPPENKRRSFTQNP